MYTYERKIEIRILTREEFNDLINNASDGLATVRNLETYGKDVYNFFQVDNESGSLVIDGVPVYCGCIRPNGFTYTLTRKDCVRKYPKTLYKYVKATVRNWANRFGEVKCEMQVEGTEQHPVRRWIEKMGYVNTTGNTFVLKRGS